MIFKDAYKEIMSGKKMTRNGLSSPDIQSSIKYLSSVTTKYFSGDDLIKVDAPFIVSNYENGTVQRINPESLINLLLEDDDSWIEYVEPVQLPIIEDAVIEDSPCSCQ